MIYAVIDTNVLVAAAKTHKPDSSTSRVLYLVLSGIIQPLICDEILEEYEQILRLPILGIKEDIASAILDKFKMDGINPGRTTSTEVHPDPTDQIFYEVSLSVEDAYMVTNNKKHFPQKPRVVNPSEMLIILSEAGII
ncbi:MAG: PIN domain-containing protein [Bacteroidales bacterium]|nr:PIN domain-containing protein [Bacteroidales bacterium]